jgi:hypothetical protein
VFAGTINGERSQLRYQGGERHHGCSHHPDGRGGGIETRQSEQWVERFSRVHADHDGALLLVAVFPPILLGASWSHSIYQALVLS